MIADPWFTTALQEAEEGVLVEYRWEAAERQLPLLEQEPEPAGDERWDVLLAAPAEHLAARHDIAPPEWTVTRVLRTPWFPSGLPSKRAEALVWEPAASPEHVFTMKTPAVRTRDIDDLRVGITWSAEAVECCAGFFPREEVGLRALAVLKDLFDAE